MKFSFIVKHCGIWAMDWMCEALLSRGGFYGWLRRPRSRRSGAFELPGERSNLRRQAGVARPAG